MYIQWNHDINFGQKHRREAIYLALKHFGVSREVSQVRAPVHRGVSPGRNTFVCECTNLRYDVMTNPPIQRGWISQFHATFFAVSREIHCRFFTAAFFRVSRPSFHRFMTSTNSPFTVHDHHPIHDLTTEKSIRHFTVHVNTM